MSPRTILLLVPMVAAACGQTDPQTQALLDVKRYIQDNLERFATAAADLQAAAPAPDADGWNATADRAAVDAMKAAWKRARVGYESVEGAIAVLFPEIDVATDERYDGFIATTVDDNLFDDHTVTGVHGIERILWADSIPAHVVAFEKSFPTYSPAAFPKSAQEAEDFKTKLCGRLVADARTVLRDFGPLALDAASAYRGVIGSLEEQLEKATLAATGEEESRYAQFTLADMRANVAAGVATFRAFKPWLEERGGAALIAEIDAGFRRIDAAYAAIEGDALPPVPSTWSSAMPTEADLATPFGRLFALLKKEADPDSASSLVSAMNRSADRLGVPRLP